MPNNINVLSELERCGISYTWAGEEEVKVACPFHSDTAPSCSISLEKRAFKCHGAGCGASGDIVKLIARFLKTTRSVVLVDFATRYTIDIGKIVDMDVVERYHAAIWQAPPLLKALHDRGVTDATIRRYRLGENDGRIQIPIANDQGYIVNIRKYLPGAPGDDKMRNMRGRGQLRLFPLEQLKYETILLCGGEIKAIAAAARLNKYGIGAVTGTGGEDNWSADFTPHFMGKRIYVCMDIDEAGQIAALTHCNRLYRIVQWLGNVVLPLSLEKFPHGDVNDFVAEGGSLKRLLNAVEEWQPPLTVDVTLEEPIDLQLAVAVTARYTGRRMRVKGLIAAMDTSPYIVPKELTPVCDRSGKKCGICSVMTMPDDMKITISPEAPALLEMIGAPQAGQRDALLHALGIPFDCRNCQFEIHSYYNIEDARISPQLEITNRSADRVMQPAYCIGPGLELNESYELIGRTLPHPKTQQSTFLISEYRPTEDALSTYEPKNLERLNIFRPDQWTTQSIQERLDILYADLEANVTRIFQRQALHLVIDLAYHSPLLFEFDDRLTKGWVEVLVLGDSAQGKSETALSLMRHYGLGEKVECKNASVAGLLGGLQQMGSRWFVTWGVIPTHDKRLVILEELKGASTEVIARLTDMRSSGIAEIPKIEKRRTHARTRLIALSNPRSDMPLSSYNFGVEAVKELVGSLEDIRRFDTALLLSSSDIDASLLNQLQRSRPKVDVCATAQLCRELILWAWTRTPKEVVFSADTTTAILDGATMLSAEFSDMIPLVDRGSGRLKIARLTAALAARTFSSTPDHQSIYVRPCHVEYILQFLRQNYCSPAMGYNDFTAAVNMTCHILDPDKIRATIQGSPFAEDLTRQLLHHDKIDMQDLQDWCGWDRYEAQQLLSFFVRKRALIREGRSYRKTPPFIALLKTLLEEDNFSVRPDFIPEEF